MLKKLFSHISKSTEYIFVKKAFSTFFACNAAKTFTYRCTVCTVLQMQKAKSELNSSLDISLGEASGCRGNHHNWRLTSGKEGIQRDAHHSL